MLKKLLVTGAVLCSFASAAEAVTLSVVGGSDFVLNGRFTPEDSAVSQGTRILAFDGVAGGQFEELTATNGLHLQDAPASVLVEFTLLGSEAGFFNAVQANGSSILSNDGNANRDSVVVALPGADGPLNFAFATNGGTGSRSDAGLSLFADNGASVITDTLLLGFLDAANAADQNLDVQALGLIEGQSVLAFFGDGTGDSDMDDLIVRIAVVGSSVQKVPVPLGGGLLLGTCVCVALMGRRRAAQRSASR